MQTSRLNKIFTLFQEKDDTKRSYIKEMRTQTGPIDKNNAFSFYHYTNEAGIDRIISTNSLRAQSCAQIEDELKINFGVNKIIKELEAKKGILIRPAQMQLINKIIDVLHSNRNNDYCAVCVTRQVDMISQWNENASKGNGFAIGLKPKALVRMAQFQCFDLVCMVYDQGLQDKITTAVVEDVLLSTIRELTDIDIYSAETAIIKLAVSYGYGTAITFKDGKYKSENEFRFVTTTALQSSKTPIYDNSQANNYFYELGGGQAGRLPIQNIIISRDLDFAIAKLYAEDLLRYNGYELTNVHVLHD